MKEKEGIIQNSLVEKVAADRLLQDACSIIEQAQATAYRAVNETLIKRNWLLGIAGHEDSA